MSCKKYEHLISAYVDQELVGGEMCLVRAHLMECECCAREEQNVRALKSMISHVPGVEPGDDFELRLRCVLQLEPAVQKKRSVPVWAYFAFAGTAASIVGWAYFSRPEPVPSHSSSIAAEIGRDQGAYSSADPLQGGHMVMSAGYEK